MNSVLVAGTILVGAVFSIPHLVIPSLSKPYFPLDGGSPPSSAITTEEVYTYASEVQEILEKKGIVRDTQLREYKEKPSPFIGETVPSYLIAGLSLVTGSVEWAFAISDVLFPSFTFLLLVSLGKRLGLRTLWAVTAALMTLFATDLVTLIPYPLPLWTYLIQGDYWNDFLIFSRSFHPQVSFPLLLGALLLVIRALERPADKMTTVIAGLATGVQFYTYIFNWTAWVATLALLASWSIVKNTRRRLLVLLTIGTVAMAVGIPYFYALHRFRSQDYSRDFFLRLTLPARTFLPITARYFILLMLITVVVRKKSLALTVTATLLFVAALLPDGAVLALGRDMEGKHWIRRIIMPFSVPVFFLLVQRCLDVAIYQRGRRWYLIEIACAGVLWVLVTQIAIRTQVDASVRFATSYRRSEKEALFAWLRDHARTDAVVGTLDPALIAELPAFTGVNNFVPISIRSMEPVSSVLDRFLLLARIYDVNDDDLVDLLTTKGFSTRIFYFQAHYQGKLFQLSPADLERILSRYHALDNQDLLSFPYTLDYLLVGPAERGVLSIDLTSISVLRNVFSSHQFDLYEVLRD